MRASNNSGSLNPPEEATKVFEFALPFEKTFDWEYKFANRDSQKIALMEKEEHANRQIKGRSLKNFIDSKMQNTYPFIVQNIKYQNFL